MLMLCAGVSIPEGKIVTKAYIQFTSKDGGSEDVSINIQAENTLDSAGFDEAEDILARSRTESINWKPSAWDSGRAGEVEPRQIFP